MRSGLDHPPVAWRQVGKSPTMDFYVDPGQPGLLLVWPQRGATETGETAPLTRSFIFEHMRERPGVALVFLDRIGGLTREARRMHMGVYGEVLLGVAYVGASPLARALMVFALGLREPVAPVRLFETWAEGREWAMGLLEAG